MLAYRWTCHVCETANDPAVDACSFCGFPAAASGTEILLARKKSVPPRPAIPRPPGAHKVPLPLTLPQLLIGVLALWAVVGILPMAYLGWTNKAGEFGDAFGAVNALFSGLAFAGVIYAIFLQRQDLALQREELSKSSGAGIRQVHIVLQQMAMRDAALQDVWFEGSPLSPRERRQYTYVNLILSNWETLYANGSMSPEQLRATVENHMRRKAFRSFWSASRDFRQKIASLGTESAREFHAAVDSAFNLTADK